MTVVGEGAAGSEGADGWSWLVKDPAAVTASAGDGRPGAARVSDASLRSAERGAERGGGPRGQRRPPRGDARLLVPGAPAAAVGERDRGRGRARRALDGVLAVRAVRTATPSAAGFTTPALERSGGLL